MNSSNMTRNYQKLINRPTKHDSAYLSSILENAPYGIAFFDTHLKFVIVNTIFADLTHRTPEKYRGLHIELLFSKKNEKIISYCRQALTTGKPIQNVEIEYISEQKNSLESCWSINCMPVRANDGSIIGVGIFVVDVTDRRKSRAELHKAIAARDDFLSIASHELKTPLTTARVLVQLLQKKLKSGIDTVALDYANRADTQLKKLTHLIKDLLDTNKIADGRLAYQAQVFDLAVLTEEAINDFRNISGKHKILLINQSNSFVKADKDKIGQVLLNFLSNAAKYSPENKKITVTLKATEQQIMVAVTDQGIGIEPNATKKIFQRFYQVVSNETGEMPSLGLGLYISSEIIRHHHGKIGVKSSEGKGSTFFFKLPRHHSNK